tara:strand:+ start:6114 stop:6740 length:627 start_codon:yes stop_codon:yes gene_type:complete
MNDKKIILRILRLDKEVYNELLVQDGSFQKSIAIFISTTILITMSGFRFITGLLDYLQENLILFQQDFQEEFSAEEFNMFKSLIEELQTFINSSDSTSSLFSSAFSSLIATVIGLLIIYLILRFLFRKDPIPKDLLIINFFASTPCLLVVPALFVSSIFIQGLLILFVSIYSIVSFGSGLKQVYLLRNIEVILLIVSLTFGTSILGGT